MSEIIAPVLATENPDQFAKIEKVDRSGSLPTKKDLTRFYELDLLAKYFREEKPEYRTIALQFPDELVCDSALTSQILNKLINEGVVELVDKKRIIILADTSYSPCCVDEVAGKHVNADVIVHFGHACLNPIEDTPVVYVFGHFDLDIDSVVGLFETQYDNREDKIVLMADNTYSCHLEEVYSRLKTKYTNLVLTWISLPQNSDAVIIPALNNDPRHVCGSTLIPNRQYPEFKGDEEDFSEYHCFHINTPPASLTLHLSTLFASFSIYNPARDNIITPRTALQKRYKYMNIARTASTIGILINTLSLKNVREVVKKVQDWIIASDKKHYTFVVGKPNVAKLANFEVVDIWVVLGCGVGGMIVDCEDFYKPIITPYELNLALQQDVMWTGKWLIDFDVALRLSQNEYDLDDQDNDENDDGSQSDSKDDVDAPVFDPVTGRYISTSRPLRRPQYISIEEDTCNESSNGENGALAAATSKELATRLSSQMIIKNTVSTSSEFLINKRLWKGLGSDYQEQDDEGFYDKEGALVEEGIGGIARGYKHADSDRV
ncbi:diphthamide biosynthesis protein [Nadsonia fulvescens var. elongata DSM 6958]|uniref:2-(3-amino-3-carboxypropyl)histidine synthase subunit 2 n=1 Tax=Nadsonia fulvescens var. elongata DSM 6958 TaxID=857566 RepID=A0A1E3PRA7_9ASCO|nr:diphthamide biosynthesis protein [Nadsonia fulvescens var. elongata DSM 6958]